MKKSTNVEMVIPASGKSTRLYSYQIENFVRLGREVKISPKANATINKPGYKSEYFVETISVVVGIGNDNTADLVMSKEAWEALNKGEEIHITTTEEFKKKYVFKKKK